MQYEISRLERDGDGYFSVHWSPLALADKYSINGSVPAMSGLAEIYYKDEGGRLKLFSIARSYYGGLRATLRERTDPALEKDPKRLSILVSHENRIYYRWSLCDSSDDLDDLIFFYLETYAPASKTAPPRPHSGRYLRIHLSEQDS